MRKSYDYYATDMQLRHLKSLLNEAFAKRYTHRLCLDPRHLPVNLSRREASNAIDALLAAKKRGWAD